GSTASAAWPPTGSPPSPWAGGGRGAWRRGPTTSRSAATATCWPPCSPAGTPTSPPGSERRRAGPRLRAMETLPQGDEKVRAVRSMFDAVAPRYDLVNRIMTFRLDVGWRRRAVRELALAPGSVVLDLACGTGDLCRELQRAQL